MRNFTFKWPHDAEEVYVTGTFDNWTKSERLERVGQVFEKTVTLPESSDKIYYKFVVDGSWTTDHTAPQEKDSEDNDNNVLLPEQMDKLEEATSEAAILNSAAPESTTAQLAGAVPLEQKKGEKDEGEQEEKPEQQEEDKDGDAQGDRCEEQKDVEEVASEAAVLNSAAPESTTAQLAGAVPLEERKDDTSPPGGFPETPATELDQVVKVDPLPAADGAVNPIKLKPGEEVPKVVPAGAVDSHVTLDKESYEKSDRIPGVQTTLPLVTGNLIPESSLPIIGANDVAINTVAPEATSATLAGQVPLEEAGVPEVVEQSQEEARVDPEASANSEGVRGKAAVEHELLDKVAEVPPTSEGTAGKGTEKAETDETTADTALDAATSAGEVALGAAAKATTAASNAVANLPEAAKEVLPGAAQEVASGEKQDATIESVSPEVPAEVKESIKEASANPEAAVNTAAVKEKKEYDAELLEKVKPAEAAGEPSAEAAGEAKPASEEAQPARESEPVEEAKPVEAVPEPTEGPAPAEAPQAETEPKPVEGEKEQAVEPPQPVEAVKTFDETKPVETPEPAEEVKPVAEEEPAATALAVETPEPAEEVKPTAEEEPAATALAVGPPKPVEAVEADPEAKAAEGPKPVEAPTAVEGLQEVGAPKPAVGQPGTAEPALAPVETPKAAEAQPVATNGATTAAGGGKAVVDGSTVSEKKKKNRISGFFSKLKHKFA